MKTIRDIGFLIKELLGQDIPDYTIRRRTDEFLEVKRTGASYREYSDKDAEDIVLIFALLLIGVRSEYIRRILFSPEISEKSEKYNLIRGNYWGMIKTCNYLINLFGEEK